MIEFGCLASLTQASIDLDGRPILIKNIDGAIIAYNKSYIHSNKISSEKLFDLTMSDIYTKEQATLHALAHQYLLFTQCGQFEYEGLKEEASTQVFLSEVKFGDQKVAAILMIFEYATKLTRPNKAINCLTNRERSVLQLLIQGNSQKQIAQLLFLSPHTIGYHLKSIYSKLSVKSSTQAVVTALTKLGMRPSQTDLPNPLRVISNDDKLWG